MDPSPGDEKRGIAILRPEHHDDWLSSKNPEFARALLELYPPEQLSARPAPKSLVLKDEGPVNIEPHQDSLF